MVEKDTLDATRDLTLDATREVSAVRARSIETSAPFPAGQLLNGRYEIQRAIGRGGMGWVYAVNDRASSGALLALKTLGDFGKSAARRSLFKAEFSTMTKLEHPNVARVYDFEQLHGSDDLFLTMELIDGAPLPRGRAWQALVDVAVQVCRALSYMHSRRIVHFDLKPANILVDARGVAKVVDFGISGAEPVMRGGSAVGTLPYMAPELLFGGGTADYRADLYSLGITLYDVIFGRVPCSTTDAYRLGLWFKSGGVRIAEDARLPSWLARIIEKLCAIEPGARFRNANAVIEAINEGAGRTHELETVETRQSYIATPSFTGRHKELERISSFIGERLGGRGNEPVLLVRGISGIGKSRLLLEARREAQLRGQLFLEADCYERSLVEYGPIADVLYRLVPIVETLSGLEIVQRALPELVKIAPRLANGREVGAAPRAANADGERVRLLGATSAFFVEAARLVPFAMYVNDLQWAARGPAQMLAHLAMRARDDQASGQPVRLAILGSYRSDEVEGRPLADSLATLREESLASELELERLTLRDVERVACSMLGIDTVPEEFLERLAQETDGNPFFVQEVMRVLFENQAVHLHDGQWVARREVGQLRIPTSIAEVFRRRFALLAEPAKDIVRVLAVHARPMHFELLSHILDSSPATLEALRELEERRIVVRLEDKSVSHNIAHDRMRETIYLDLPAAERRSWHERIARELENLTSELSEKPLDELAGHYREAGVRDKALSYSLAAGRRALARYANEAALEHLGYAARQGAIDGDLATAEDFAEASMRTGDTAGCTKTLRRALPLARRAEDRVRLHAALSRAERAALNLDACIDEGWRALEVFGEKRPTGLVSKIVRLCGALLWLFRQREVVASDENGSEMAGTLALGYGWLATGYIYQGKDPLLVLYSMITSARHAATAGRCEARALAHTGLGTALAWLGYPTSAKKWLIGARRDAEALHAAEAVAVLDYAQSGWVPGHGAPLPDCEAKLRQAIVGAQLAGSQFMPTALWVYGTEMVRIGRFSAALEEHRNTMGYMRRAMPTLLDDQAGRAVLPTILLHATGDAEEAMRSGIETIEQARKLGQGGALQLATEFAAAPFAACGRVTEACASLEESWQTAKEAHSYLNTRNVLRLLPRLYLSKDPSDKRAQRRAARVVRRGRRLVRSGHLDKLPLVELGEAMVLEARGRRAKADACFERALTSAREQGVRFYEYDILHQRGLALHKRGDRRGALRDLQKARALAEDCGDVYTHRLCDEALASLGE